MHKGKELEVISIRLFYNKQGFYKKKDTENPAFQLKKVQLFYSTKILPWADY